MGNIFAMQLKPVLCKWSLPPALIFTYLWHISLINPNPAWAKIIYSALSFAPRIISLNDLLHFNLMTCDKAGSKFIPLGYMFSQRHHKFDHSTDFKETSGGNFESKRTYHEDFFLWFCRMSSTFYVFKIDAILMIALMENVKNSLWMIQWHGNPTCLSRSCREIILGFWLACSFHFSNEMILLYSDSTTQKRLTGNGTRVDQVKQSATKLMADSRTKHHHLPAEDLYRRERTPHSKFCNSW